MDFSPNTDAQTKFPDQPQSVWARFYVPEIHDVHPAMDDRLDALAAFFPVEARAAIAYLAVPHWAGDAPIDAAFASRVKALGGVIVLHGHTHRRGPSALNRLVHGHDDRREFAGLDAGEAAMRIERGLIHLGETFGERPRWFCAPGWRQEPELADILRRVGFDGFQLMDRLVLRDGGEIALPAVNFDVGERAFWHALARPPRAAQIRRLLDRGAPFRLTLHPGDLDHPATWRQARDLMKRLDIEGWRAVSLDEAVTLWRTLNRVGQAGSKSPSSL